MSYAPFRGSHDAEPAARRRVVVVLCGEPRLRDLLGYWLASSVPALTIAADGREAARVIAGSGEATVLLTDRTVPPWPGLPPLPMLKQTNPELRVIVVDRDAPAGGPRRGSIASGADVILAHPLSRAAVLSSIAAEP